jgi:hypothetical protein
LKNKRKKFPTFQTYPKILLKQKNFNIWHQAQKMEARRHEA